MTVRSTTIEGLREATSPAARVSHHEGQRFEHLPTPPGGHITQALLDEGILYLLNNTLHPFGYALGVEFNADDQIVGLILSETDDPEGFTYSDEDHARGRRRLRGAFTRLAGSD